MTDFVSPSLHQANRSASAPADFQQSWVEHKSAAYEHLKRGRHEEAAASAQAALEVATSHFSLQQPHIESHSLSAAVLTEAGRESQAYEHMANGLSIVRYRLDQQSENERAILKEHEQNLLDRMGAVSLVLFNKNRECSEYGERAIDHFVDALAVAQENPVASPTIMFRAYANSAIALYAAGRQREADLMCSEACAFEEEAKQENFVRFSEMLSVLAGNLGLYGRYQKAVELYDRALNYLDQASQRNPDTVLPSKRKLIPEAARAFAEAGDIERAGLLLESFKLIPGDSAFSHKDVLDYQRESAGLLREVGMHWGSEKRYREYLDSVKEFLPHEEIPKEREVDALLCVAGACINNFKLCDAVNALDQVQELLGSGSLEEVRALQLRAEVVARQPSDEDQNQFDEAIECLRQALAILHSCSVSEAPASEEYLQRRKQHRAAIVRGIALFRYFNQEFSDARAQLEVAWDEILEETGRSTRASIADLHLLEGLIKLAEGNEERGFQQVQAGYAQMLELDRGRDLEALVPFLRQMGNCLARAGKPEEALRYYDRARGTLEKRERQSHPILADVLLRIADLELDLGCEEQYRSRADVIRVEIGCFNDAMLHEQSGGF